MGGRRISKPKNKNHNRQEQAGTPQYLVWEKELVATKGECLVTTYIEDGTWTSRLRSFLSITVLKICFTCFHFFTYFYISWATLWDVALSDYYESILFFHVGSSTFQISTKLAVIVAQWRGQMICTNSAITVIIAMMMMMMMIVWSW